MYVNSSGRPAVQSFGETALTDKLTRFYKKLETLVLAPVMLPEVIWVGLHLLSGRCAPDRKGCTEIRHCADVRWAR